jgi:biopolymer transport protein ExbD
MLWVMLPIATALSGPVIDVVPVVDVVLVEIVIVVDVDVAVAVPVTVAPIVPSCAPSHSTPKARAAPAT